MSKRFAMVGAFVLSAMVWVSYYPALRMGFYLDDYYNIERAGRIEWPNALSFIFDPRAQTLWYRPLQGLQFFIEYQLFGGNANAYHLVNIAYHAINVLLLGAIVSRISKNGLLGLASAFFFATFTVYISGVNWIGIVEPLFGIFYLLSFWFWWLYLEREDRKDYLLAMAAFVLALMSKQTAVTIPIVFFTADRLLMKKNISLARWIRDYAPFVLAATIFIVIQYATPSTHTFAGTFGWQMGPQMAYILWQYAVLFFSPWGAYPSIDLNPVEVGDATSHAWAVLAIILLTIVLWHRRSRLLLFLAAFSLLTLLPVLPFPFLEHRYLYLPMISAAIIMGLILNHSREIIRNRRSFIIAPACGLALIAFGNGIALNDSMVPAADWARTLRVPFRDIERQHPTFPKDTLLYFIDPITPTEGGLSGMFFLRYGKDITVRNWTQYAGLREHNVSYVYYFDEARRAQEIRVDKNAATQASLHLPVDYQAPIRLEGYEVAKTTIERGSPIVLILYWRASSKIDRDYTVFAHLVDASGKILAGYDSPPRKNQAPTRLWEPGMLVSDAILLPVPPDAPLGSGYQIQVGLYSLATLERLAFLDSRGLPSGDVLTIESFTIVE